MAAVATVGVQLSTAKAVQNAKKLSIAVGKIKQSAEGAASSTKKLGQGAKGTAAIGAAAKAATPGVAALGGALKAALGPIAILTTAAGALSSAFSTLAEQDFAEAKVRSLGVNSDELTKRLSDVSRELSGQASVVELTGAAYDVASAGFTNAADAANILKAASLGATGGFSDINTVGDAATSVLNAYGLEADKAGKLVDGFIQTQNDGKIIIGEYAANIAKVAPVAAALGVPLEEVNAAVAQITAGGQGAEVTFTALKTAFAQIAAGKVGKEFKDFGINIDSSTLASDGLAGTLEKIKKSGADAGTIIKAFGTEAGPSILALLNDTEKFNQLLENQKNSQGQAAKAAFEASNTINGALKRLQTAFTNLFADQSELGILLKGTLQVAAVTVEVLAAGFKSILAPIRGVIAGVTNFASKLFSLGEGVNIAFELEKGFQSFMKTLDDIGAGIESVFTVFTETFYELAGVAVNFGMDLNAALGDPIGNAISSFTSFRDFAAGIFTNLSEFAAGFFSGFRKNAGDAVTRVTSFFGGLFSGLAGLIDKFVSILPDWLKDSLGGKVAGMAANVSDAVGKAIGNIKEIVQAVPEKIASTFGSIQGRSEGQGGTTPAANNIQKTAGALTGVTGGKVDKEAEKAAKKAAQIAKASADRVKSLEQQTLLASALTEEERKQFERQIEIQNILDRSNVLTDEQLQAELEATTNLHEQLDLTEQIKDAQSEAAKKKKEADDAEAARVQELNSFYQGVADTIQSGIVNGIMGAIDGSKSLKESLSGLLKQVGGMFLNQAIGSFMPKFGAEGLYVNGPTNAVIGEGGEPEYVIPESKMRESMARYSAGSRGAGVIPDNEGSAAASAGGGGGGGSVDVRFNVERINSVDYVTASEFQAGIAQAAQQGAREGERRALGSMQNSPAVRRRVRI
tara:strand:- start:3879 stop:6620 length:2742 start_codon:yes stop_codon:yes gene_type:complete